MTQENPLPIHNREAERATIGAVLRSPDVLDAVAEIVGAKDFYLFAHQLLFQAMLDLQDAGKPIDIVTLADAIHEAGKTADMGGHAYLVELYDASPSPFNAANYAGIVREMAIRRELNHLSEELARYAQNPHGPADLVLSQAVADVMDLAERRAKNELVSVGEASAMAIDLINERTKAGATVGMIETGIENLDGKLGGGFEPGGLIIIAARTSKGKTALALQMAYNAACLAKRPTLFFSLEQSAIEIGDRINAVHTEINSKKFKNPKELNNEEIERLLEASRFFPGKPLFIDKSRSMTVRNIASIARRFKRQNGLGMIVVDYLQLMESHDTRYVSRHEFVAGISRGLKNLAGDLGCPVVALSQLNRETEKRADKKPQLSDLRESGAIEQDANTVLLLYTAEEEEIREDPRLKDVICVIIAKQRNGEIGNVNLRFDKATGRIRPF